MTTHFRLPTLASLAAQLENGSITSATLTRQMLEKAQDPHGEGSRAFTFIDAGGALARARACDEMRAKGQVLGPLMGLPISIKDLFDIEGQVTRAGSKVLADAPTAREDAPIVARLKAAGAVIIGRSNMVEFAFSGIGLNPHFGTPKNAWDRKVGRVPGGSSSGAGVSVTDGMAAAAIGTDTGGSVRIPAALCGLTGFKPTASRITRQGAFPLSHTLDSIGPIAASVACCALLDEVMTDAPLARTQARALSQLRFVAPTNWVLDALDSEVARDFSAALATLRAKGALVIEKPLGSLDFLFREVMPFASFAPAEALAIHRKLLLAHESQYDQRVASRILKGGSLAAVDYIELFALRQRFQGQMSADLGGFDALLMPTVPVVAPPITPLVTDDALYWKTNALLLRNTSSINFLDGCALSLPMHRPGTAPTGLSLAQSKNHDASILALAAMVEEALEGSN